MAYKNERKDGSISVFENEKQNDRQPDYRGDMLLNGVTYRVALWKRRNGVLSGQVEVDERVRRDKETHNLIAGAAYLAARQQESPAFTEPAQPAPVAPNQVDDIEDLPF